MIYNDFPILEASHYEILNEKYKSSEPFNRRSFAIKIQQQISTVLNSELSNNQYNLKISAAIKDSESTIKTLSENISSIISINLDSNKMFSVNVFQYVKNLLNISSSLNNWFSNEPKEYYKNFLSKAIENLNNSIICIFSALEKSNILFFKHM